MKHLRGRAIFKLIFKLSKTTVWELLPFEIQLTKGLAYFYNFYIVRNSLPLSFSNSNSIKKIIQTQKSKVEAALGKECKEQMKSKKIFLQVLSVTCLACYFHLCHDIKIIFSIINISVTIANNH